MLVVIVYFAFGKILTLTLEAHVLYNLKAMRFQQRMKVLFANWPFLKS